MANFKIISVKNRNFLTNKIHGFPLFLRNARPARLVELSTCFFHNLLIFKTSVCQL